MKKKNFVSTADALIYVIKRLDGTEATISDGDDEGDDPVVTPTTKKLLIKTYSIYSYESQFIMEVPNDAPNFGNFADVLRYLDSIGKIPTKPEEWSPSTSDLVDMKDYIIQIRGKLADMFPQSFMLVHRAGAEPSEFEFNDIMVATYALDTPSDVPYSKYYQSSTFSIFDDFEKDDVKYADDFEISTN